MKGGAKRVVCMALPKQTASQPSGAAILRQLEGYQDCSESTEALEMLKGGFGLADAPNLFTNRVDQIFRQEGLRPILSDGKIYVRHNEQGQLILQVSAHMDDFKGTGERAQLEWLRNLLRRHFGENVKMTIEDTFIHTCIRHTVVREKATASDGSTQQFKIVLDQNDYAAALKPVEHHSMASLKDDVNLTGLLFSCYLTLLGALAWLMQTRIDVAVYVAYLQRYCKQPTARHLRMMNRLLRFVHRSPKSLTYAQLPEPLSLVMVGDSAFQAPSKEEEAVDPLVMRGYVLAFAHETPNRQGDGSTHQLHLIEWSCGKQKHVCRGVWSSELHNQCDMVEMGTIISAFAEEVRHGPGSAESIKTMLDRDQCHPVRRVHGFLFVVQLPSVAAPQVPH